MAFIPQVDTSVPLSVVNPLDAQAKGFELGQQMLQSQRGTEQYEQQKSQQQALRDIFSKADTSTPEGQADLVRQVGRINPQAAMELQGQFQQGALRSAQTAEAKAKTGEAEAKTGQVRQDMATQKREEMTGFLGDANQALANISQIIPDKTILPGTTTYKERMDRANKMVDEWSAIMKTKYGDSPEIAQIIQKIDAHDWQTPDEFRGHLQQFQKLQALAKQQAPLTNVGKANADIASGAVTPQQGQSLIERETAPPGVLSPPAEAQRIRIAKAGAENREAESEKLAKAKQDMKASVSLQGGRESVFNQRVMNSANEAVAALQNLVQLPISSSTGFAGYGRHRTGIFDAGKEALAAKLTTQDQQLYSTMIAGLTRSMASIEMSGLAGGQRLSEQIGPSVTIGPEDTQLTKLSKLAEARQIVERGMETLSTNPRLSPEQRGLIDKVNRDVARAIPWTQQNIIDLANAQAEGRNVSLRDVMKQKQGGTTNTAPAEAIEHLKAHPELKEAFKEKYGYLPSGL